MFLTEILTHPDDLDEDGSNKNKLLSGELKSYKMEKRYIRKDGSVIWIILNCSLLYDAATEQSYFVGVIENITD